MTNSPVSMFRIHIFDGLAHIALAESTLREILRGQVTFRLESRWSYRCGCSNLKLFVSFFVKQFLAFVILVCCVVGGIVDALSALLSVLLTFVLSIHHPCAIALNIRFEITAKSSLWTPWSLLSCIILFLYLLLLIRAVLSFELDLCLQWGYVFSLIVWRLLLWHRFF